MRFPIRISSPIYPLFRAFGFSRQKSFVDLEDGRLRVRFGTADESIPLADVERVERRRWPVYFGLGAKLDVKNGVAYVGSFDGVVRIWLKRPHPMNVWGPFSRSTTRAITVSVEDADEFIAALEKMLSQASASDTASGVASRA